MQQSQVPHRFLLAFCFAWGYVLRDVAVLLIHLLRFSYE